MNREEETTSSHGVWRYAISHTTGQPPSVLVAVVATEIWDRSFVFNRRNTLRWLQFTAKSIFLVEVINGKGRGKLGHVVQIHVCVCRKRNSNVPFLHPVADPGEGPTPTPIFLDQTEVRRAEKFFLETGPPLSRALDDRPHPLPPPYLKAWIRTFYTNGLCWYFACPMWNNPPYWRKNNMSNSIPPKRKENRREILHLVPIQRHIFLISRDGTDFKRFTITQNSKITIFFGW